MKLAIKRLIQSKNGKIFLSIILGLGLASIFRRACSDRGCLVFNAPSIKEIKDKVYNFNKKCYRFTEENVTCDNAKKIVSLE